MAHGIYRDECGREINGAEDGKGFDGAAVAPALARELGHGFVLGLGLVGDVAEELDVFVQVCAFTVEAFVVAVFEDFVELRVVGSQPWDRGWVER